MAISVMHMATVHMNLGVLQFNNTMCKMYYIKGSIDTLLSQCKLYYIAKDSTPTLDVNMRSIIAGKAQTVAARCMYS
jgi:hypothetical protein